MLKASTRALNLNRALEYTMSLMKVDKEGMAQQFEIIVDQLVTAGAQISEYLSSVYERTIMRRTCLLITNCCQNGDATGLKQVLETLAVNKQKWFTGRLITGGATETLFECAYSAVMEHNIECAKLVVGSHTSLRKLPVWFAHRDRWELVTDLLQEKYIKYFYLDATFNNRTLLTLLIDAGKLDLLKHLLKYNININKRDARGTPIGYAIDRYVKSDTGTKLKNWIIFRLLISHGYDINNGVISYTTLDYRLQQQKLRLCELVETLILAGADLSLVQRIRSMHLGEKQNLQVIIQQSRENVPTLKHCSRLGVRAACRSNTPIQFHKLREVLPSVLVDFLMLPEIDKIEQKYGIIEEGD
eukprot:GHVU01179646.1.p1 GENE.GHVU01179646.1~~GHVU01179646.1.p1  ORF type:complete len:358 (-),score=21.67 GHVU01179646.1:300-1373(-)